MLALDLACGQNPQPGFTGVDFWPGAEIVCDLTRFPWPWDDDTVGRVVCSHYVEHVVDLIGFMNELHRVMAPDARALIVHPYAHSNRAWQDPTHVRALNEDSWRYYNADERHAMGVDHYPIVANFAIEHVDFVLAPGRTTATPQELRHLHNIVDDLRVELRCLK
jgi:SAM-dependent methyltransferase